MPENKIYKIKVDRDLCIGAASCLMGEGEKVFELDDENKAVIKQADKKDSGPAERGALAAADISDEALLSAAQACPTKAIFLYDKNGEQIYP